MTQFFVQTVKLGLTVALLVLAAGYLGAYHPALDTLAHFRLHIAAGLIAMFFLLLLFRQRLVAIACLIAGLVGLYGAAPGLPLSASRIAPDDRRPVHAMLHFNLYWLNREKEVVIERMRRIDPLLISLSEVSTDWMPHINSLADQFPYKAHCPEHGVRGGVMILSKLPLVHDDDFCGKFGTLMKTSMVLDDGMTIDVVSAHPRWPWPASGPELYASYSQMLSKLRPDALIAGDFNATPWSHAARQFARDGELDIVSGTGPTWLFVELPGTWIRLAGLPIDFAMNKGRIKVLSATSMDDWGSDHLPVLIRFQVW